MKFIYQARTKEGKIQSGTIEASSREAAAALLRKYNLYITSLKEVKITPLFLIEKIKLFQRVSKKDLAILSRQLGIMIDSRIPVVQSLLILASQIRNPTFREKIIKISRLVEEGNPLSKAFSYFPEIFDLFYISILKSGEASGKISESLNYLSEHLEREYNINSQIRNAMVYPIFILIVLITAIVITFIGVVPGFVKVLQEVKVELPFITRLMLKFYSFLINFGWLSILAFIALVIFFIYYLRTKEGKRIYDKFSLKIPLFGPFFQKIFLVRFAENLSTLIMAGISITKALQITKGVIGNSVYKEILSETEKMVSQGEKINFVLSRYPEVVPTFVSQMVRVGEDTGKLDKTLREIVNFYQGEIDRTIKVFISLFEPILIIVLGVIIGLLAISLFMPLYNIIGSI